MRQRPIPELGPLELKLVRILWRHGWLTAPQVLAAYNDQAEVPLAYTTVMTLLGRLVEKGVLVVNRERQPFRFSPALSREQVLRQRVRDFVDLFFEGQSMDLVLRLVEEEPLSEESVQRLETVLREHKSRTKPKRRSRESS